MSRTKRQASWFVRRAVDGAILGQNGRWYRQFAHAGDIKFYSSSGRAQKFGLSRIRLFPEVCNGLQEIGQCHAVYPGESVDITGKIHDSDGNHIR